MRAHLTAEGYDILNIMPLPPARHVFTHIEWDLTGWDVAVADTNEMPLTAAEEDAKETGPLLWVRRAELANIYSVPAAFGYFTPH